MFLCFLISYCSRQLLNSSQLLPPPGVQTIVQFPSLDCVFNLILVSGKYTREKVIGYHFQDWVVKDHDIHLIHILSLLLLLLIQSDEADCHIVRYGSQMGKQIFLQSNLGKTPCPWCKPWLQPCEIP